MPRLAMGLLIRVVCDGAAVLAVCQTRHPADSMITAMTGRGRPWFATHAQIADLADAPPTDAP
jgi:hypothetical protein